MTVATSTSKSGPYAGAGTTGPFTVTFRFLENSHLQVIKTSTAGIDSTLALTTDYAVSGAGASTGTVTLVSALLSGEKLTIIRNVPFTQEADYVQNDAFPAESHERALDKLTMETQQLKEAIDRSIKLPPTSTEDVAALTADLIRVADSADNIDTVADNIASVNANAAAIAAIQTNAANITDIQNAEENAELVVNATSQAVDGEKDLFTAGVGYTKGATTQLTLAYTPAKSGTVKVFFDGVFQHLTEWSLAGKVITFTTAIPADKVEVHYVIPSQFVGLSNADLLVLGEAESTAQAGAATATTQAGAALAAKLAAEAAAAASLASAKTYTTTAAGLAATTSGQVFLVTTANQQIYSVYSNSAGSAVLLGELNIADGSKFFLISGQPDNIFILADVNEKIVLRVDSLGRLHLPGLGTSVQDNIDALNALLTQNATPLLLGFSDSADKVYAYFDDAAGLHLAGLSDSVQNLLNAMPTPTTTTKYRLYTFLGNGPSLEVLAGYEGTDGAAFPTNLNVTYTGLPSGFGVRDPSVFYDDKNKLYWMTHTTQGFSTAAGNDKFGVAKSADGISWTYVATILTGLGASSYSTWAPEWFVDEDGTVYITVHCSTSPTLAKFDAYLLRAKDIGLTQFENLGVISGTRIPNNCIDTYIFRRNGLYFCFVKDETAKTLQIAYSSNIRTGYDEWIDLTSFGSFIEGPNIIQFDNGTYRIYFDRYSGSPLGLRYRDTTDLFQTFSAEQAVTSPITTERHGSVITIQG